MGLLPVLYLSASLFPTPHPHRPEAQTPPHLFSSSACNDTVTCTTQYAHVSHQNGTPHPPEKAGTLKHVCCTSLWLVSNLVWIILRIRVRIMISKVIAKFSNRLSQPGLCWHFGLDYPWFGGNVLCLAGSKLSSYLTRHPPKSQIIPAENHCTGVAQSY